MGARHAEMFGKGGVHEVGTVVLTIIAWGGVPVINSIPSRRITQAGCQAPRLGSAWQTRDGVLILFLCFLEQLEAVTAGAIVYDAGLCSEARRDKIHPVPDRDEDGGHHLVTSAARSVPVILPFSWAVFISLHATPTQPTALSTPAIEPQARRPP